MFEHNKTEHALFLYDVLNVTNVSAADLTIIHVCKNKKENKKILVLRWEIFHVQLINF